MTDLQKFLSVAAKHGLWAALAIAVLWFARVDVVLPMMGTLRDMADSMKALERGQDKLLYHTVRGTWLDPNAANVAEKIKKD